MASEIRDAYLGQLEVMNRFSSLIADYRADEFNKETLVDCLLMTHANILASMHKMHMLAEHEEIMASRCADEAMDRILKEQNT